MLRSCLVLALLAFAVATASEPKIGVQQATVYLNKDGTAFLKEGILDTSSGAASGSFSDDIAKDGWAKLNITTSHKFTDASQAYSAGYLEGALTYQRISNWISNNGPFTPPGYVVEFLNNNLLWMEFLFKQLPNDPIAQQTYYMLQQLKGLADGYNSKTSGKQNLTTMDFLYLNAQGDISDLQAGLPNGTMRGAHKPDTDGCSGLVRFSPTDLYVAQTAWTEFGAMMRILKTYQLDYSNVNATTVSFSSYPGQLWSGDDFYITSAGLAVIETTSGIFNMSLYDNLSEDSILTWIRVMVANRLAGSASDWAEIFATYNSGTYTNQWIVVDYKKYKAGSHTLAPDTVWLLETIPGYAIRADVTAMVQQQGYFGSYNTWYFPFVWTIAGYPQEVKAMGPWGFWFVYNTTSRAQIFRRNATTVDSLQDMMALMTYNNWQHDPLSMGFPENGIAARSDLYPANQTAPFSALGTRCHGGIDSKVVSSSLISQMSFWAIGAPTHVQQPVFSFAAAPICTGNYAGLPASYDFDWIQYGGKQ
jgi:hypothetical protein